MIRGPVVPKGDVALVGLRGSPNAKTTVSQDLHGDAAPKLRVSDLPVDDEANVEVERFVAERTGAAPSRVRVLRGLSGKGKTVSVDGAERVREVPRSHPR